MAEEVQYSDSATAKRKYDDQSAPLPGRRATGFSSQSPDPGLNYNSVPPPPVDEIEAAKQKAQQIAARLFSTAEAEAKRPRVENGASAGYASADSKPFSYGSTGSFSSDYGQKPTTNAVASIPSSYGYPGPSKKIEIPNGRVGVIIGKAGETIKYLQLQSGAKIQVTRDMDADPNSPTRGVELMGTPEQISKAEQLINDVLNEAESGGSGAVSRRLPGHQGGSETYVTKIPNEKVGLVIGKGGETIKNMQNSTGARIQVIPLRLPPGDTSRERTLQIEGSTEQIEAAKLMVNEVIEEEDGTSAGVAITPHNQYDNNYVQNRHSRNSSMVVYSQQGYQSQAPTSWAPPGQQPGYGYVQPGAYAGQTPQYGMSQPQYAGYPPQPTSGGYAPSWDQASAGTTQQTTQAGGYDYYSQQSAPQQQQALGGAPGSADNAGYGYTHDAYGGYQTSAPQSGYVQQQTGYDQQHGYSSTPGYGNTINPTTEGQNPSYGAQGDGNQAPAATSAGQQGYSASHQPSPNPSYPPQANTGYTVPPNSQAAYGTPPSSGYGASYGAPQAQKPAPGPPAYGQSPTAQAGYVQPGYPPVSQAGYAQQDSGSQRAPSSGYGTSATSGYAPPPYAAAPSATQPNYGGQQPPYNSSYGSGYTQPPAYSADSNAAPTSKTVPPKASPES